MHRYLLLTLLLLSGLLKAQVTGKITDDEDAPLPGASVAAYQGEELINGTTTEIDGAFSLKLPKGNYRVEVTFVAFQTYNRQLEVPSENAAVDFGTVALLESNTALEEVTVEGQAQLMEFKQDKRIFNVSKDVTSVGSNASDILNNVPSVSVDVEGNVALRGSQNVRILIDGKPSGLIGSDPAAALRMLQSSMIERIEVITNPSARYDAEGEAGIINIVLKKEDRKGVNGNFEVNTGYPDNYGASAQINYRTGKFNWFANGAVNYRRSPGGGFNDQQFYLPSSDSSFSRYTDRYQERGGLSATLRVGADYSLTPTQTITGTFLYRPSEGNNIATLDYLVYDADGELIQNTTRNDDEIETERNLEADLHYENQFKGKDHKLTADFKFQDEDDRERSDILQTFADDSNDLNQKVRNQEDEQTILIQTDYVKPFNKDRRFEVGAKATLRDIINDYSVRQQDSTGTYVPIEAFTNRFRYKEYIYAAYAMYSDALFTKLTYQLGLRAEYSDISTKVFSESEQNIKQYVNFFPSVFLTWKIDKQSDYQLNYSRRISRPWFRALLPFSNYSDNVNLWLGNPHLDPEYTDSYETGYLRYLNKASIYGGIYYRHRTNVTERIQFASDTGTTITRPVNLAVQDAYGFEFNFTHDPAKWFSYNLNFNLYQAITTGSYKEVDYGNTNFTSQGQASTKFKFWDSDLQLTFNYRGPSTSPQGRDLGIYTMDIGWSKDFWKDKATLTFSVRDLFNTRRRRGYTYGDNFNSYGEFQWRQRQLMLTFTYRLNQNQSNRAKRGGQSFDGEADGM